MADKEQTRQDILSSMIGSIGVLRGIHAKKQQATIRSISKNAELARLTTIKIHDAFKHILSQFILKDGVGVTDKPDIADSLKTGALSIVKDVKSLFSFSNILKTLILAIPYFLFSDETKEKLKEYFGTIFSGFEDLFKKLETVGKVIFGITGLAALYIGSKVLSPIFLVLRIGIKSFGLLAQLLSGVVRFLSIPEIPDMDGPFSEGKGTSKPEKEQGKTPGKSPMVVTPPAITQKPQPAVTKLPQVGKLNPKDIILAINQEGKVWDEKSKRWRDTATGLYTKPPVVPTPAKIAEPKGLVKLGITTKALGGVLGALNIKAGFDTFGVAIEEWRQKSFFDSILSWISGISAIVGGASALLSLIPVLAPITAPIALAATTLSMVADFIKALKNGNVLSMLKGSDSTWQGASTMDGFDPGSLGLNPDESKIKKAVEEKALTDSISEQAREISRQEMLLLKQNNVVLLGA